MNIFMMIMVACWAIFLVYWLVTAFSAKRSLRGSSWWTGAWFRIAIFFVIVILLRVSSLRFFFVENFYVVHTLVGLNALGAILSVAGVSLALWARTVLGRNWGMPMSIKEDRKLVTAGPYAYIRHPIYAALFLMLLGSACIEGAFWLMPFLAYFAYFIWAARSEEKRLTQEFPEQYPAYMSRTKMLIPFVF